MNKLIVAEKPSVALRIAMALGKPRTNYFNGIRYYELQQGQDNVFIVAAAGHLFTIRAKAEGSIPLFDIEWVASYKVNKESYYTKKYLDAIESIGKKCQFFINACDYDIEGTVIGTNIIGFVTTGDVNRPMSSHNVMRMRFSTTTNQDLIQSYEHLNEFDRGNFDAGETRHTLDWFWGINMSRALMRALTKKGVRKTLSIGRVQGPTLGILARRELEIKDFVPKPYWRVTILARNVAFDNSRGEIFDKALAQRIHEQARKGEATVKTVESREKTLYPFPPFDLTSLQLEANRVHRIDPTRTLAIAQVLYERSYISYPRTSSQKLPATLNLPRIISMLAKVDKYSALAEKLTSEKRFRPIEGAKEDEAHPAIYPTGEFPQRLNDEEEKVYDLVARRFLSCFADRAVLQESRVVLQVAEETYAAKGDTIKSPGWLDFYLHYKPKTSEMPHFDQGERLSQLKSDIKELKTLPPKRYTKASLISLLESKDLGTKATRTEVIDTLFRREYIRNASIEVTGFGMSVYNALSKYCGQILDEDMTRRLEKDMDEIAKGMKQKEAVLKEGKGIITSIITEFTTNEPSIGDELMKGLAQSELQSSLGKCTCGNGNLLLRRSRMGKTFVGCSDWPRCNKTYSVPQNAKIVPTGKVCEICHTPRIKVFRRDKKVFEMDLDPACPTKAGWANKVTEQGMSPATAERAAKQPAQKETIKIAVQAHAAAPATAAKPARGKRSAAKTEAAPGAEKKRKPRKAKRAAGPKKPPKNESGDGQ
ncbi:MAG: DNA topoisomerase I [Candidatus Micrarchaeota archaeon]|nr:DNA topoisomerase I [Candidatus Micrarchaeota archaeon]